MADVDNSNSLDPAGVIATAPLVPWPLALRQAAQSARVGLLLFDRLELMNLGRYLNLENPADLEFEGIGRIEGATLQGKLIPERTDLALPDLLGPRAVFRGNDALAAHIRDLSTIASAGVLETAPLPSKGGHLELTGLLTDSEIEAHFSVDEVAGSLQDILWRDGGPANDKNRVAFTAVYGYWLGQVMSMSSATRIPMVSGVASVAASTTAGAATPRSLDAGLQYVAQRLLLSAVPGFFNLPIDRLLAVREDLRVPMLNFRSAISRASQDIDPASEADLVALWVERVQPELASLAVAYKEHSAVRSYITSVSATEVLAAGSGVMVALQSPESLITALSLAFPALFGGVRVRLGRQSAARAIQAEHPYLLLHELGADAHHRGNRAERRRQQRESRRRRG